MVFGALFLRGEELVLALELPREVHDAVLANLAGLAVAYLAVKLPARLGLVYVGGAVAPSVLGALGYLPARGVFQKFLDAVDADFLGVDEFAEAAEPLDVVLRVVAVLVAAGGFNQAVLLVKPQRLIRRAYKLCHYTDGV